MNKDELKQHIDDLQWLHDNVDMDNVEIEYDYEGWVRCVYEADNPGKFPDTDIGEVGEINGLVELSKKLQRLQDPKVIVTIHFQDLNGYGKVKRGEHDYESLHDALFEGWFNPDHRVSSHHTIAQALSDPSNSNELSAFLVWDTIELEHGYNDSVGSVIGGSSVYTIHGDTIHDQPIENILSYLKGEPNPWKKYTLHHL